MAKHEGDQGGRPPYQPTEADRNTVKSMAACGMTHIQIARCLGTDGIHEQTLRTHFRRELDTAMDMANATVGSVVYRKAMEGEGWACCFWLKTRAGWKETNVTELTGKDGTPLFSIADADRIIKDGDEGKTLIANASDDDGDSNS